MTATSTSPAANSRDRTTYREIATRAVAMPLGGIGTGSIALTGDGSLRQWQIHNQVNHLACVPHSFFAVWTKRKRPASEPVARVLQSSAHYQADGPEAPPTSNDHVVPIPHRRLMQKLPGVARTVFTGEYPIARIGYEDDDLSVDVSMEAFNPFVPLDSDDSGIPGICFNLTVSNPTDETRRVSVAASLQNAVGWDGVAPIFDTRCSLYGGNANDVVRTGEATTITMGSTRLPDNAATNGSMALATTAPDATWHTQWDDLAALWEVFSATGRLGNLRDTTPSAAGRTWNGALAVPFELAPGESREIPFVIAWHFPNRYVNHSQRFSGLDDDKSRFWLGNRYATRFASALDVVGYLTEHRERLARTTRLARDTFYDTTLPFPLIESVVSQISVARSPTCFWDEAGHFWGFEGCNGASTSHHTDGYGGCCPLNCTHVWNYEMTLSRLYPELDRDMRDTEWDIQQHPSGYLPHRVTVPTYLPRPWERTIGGPEKPALDGLLGGILKTWREYRGSGDRAWLERAWPAVKRGLEHIWTEHDPERSGVILGEQPNTYDISIYGLNTFTGTLYLAALRAVEEMATLLGEQGLVAECRAVFARGREQLEDRLWNGEYYIQEVDLDQYPEQNWGLGCHADHLLGQWWAHYLGLGHLLDPERVRSAAIAIFEHNFRESFDGFVQGERQFATDDDAGLLVCTWPNGGRPDVPTRYSDEVWTGIEYEVAALLLHQGEAGRAVRILEATRDRYDGRKQNPWNDIECGDHYVRAMSSWALLEAASGFDYDAGAGTIGFAPRIDPDAYRAPFVARDGWGTFSQETGDGRHEARIDVAWGELRVAELRLATQGDVSTVTASVGVQQIEAALEMEEGTARVSFPEPATVRPGDELRVALA